MSKGSIAVKRWRDRTKQRIVEAMGEKCQLCSYDRCNASFDFHHLDRTTKKFSFGGMRANPVSWKRIVEELKKCIMLCANCHREVEAGFTSCEGMISAFDNAYSEYDWNEKEKSRNIGSGICEYCLEEYVRYNTFQRYCSNACEIGANMKKRSKASKKGQVPKLEDNMPL